jgi:hypothetical protein
MSDDEHSMFTETEYQKAADALSAAIDAFVARLPFFELPHERTARVYGYLNLPEEFVGAAIAAVDQSEVLRGIDRMKVGRAREVRQFRDAFRPLARKVIAAGEALDFTIDSQLAELNAEALQIYRVARGLAADPATEGIVAHVETMKRLLGRAGIKKNRIPRKAKREEKQKE